MAGAIVRGIGSRVFWVETGGFDTHAEQGAGGGAYGNLMGTLGDGLWAFYSDVRNQGLANDTTVIVFSEFGRRISENGSAGTDHGAAGLMMALGGWCAAGSTARRPRSRRAIRRWRTTPATCATRPTSGPSMRELLDQWLGVNSVPILNGDFRAGAPAIF